MRLLRPFRQSILVSISLLTFAAATALGQALPDGGMLRYPDVSAERIVFVYANDLWTVAREGGMASPLASPPGGERNPRFNEDGDKIAFTGNYDGGTDIYVCPAGGGMAERITFHSASEQLYEWAPDGRLIYGTNGFSGLGRMTQLFTITEDEPYPQPLPVPYGTNGTISDDGQWLAYTPYSRDTRTWKRYRGGMASDIWLFHLESKRSLQMTDWEGTDSLPMWYEQTVYYLSDAGPNHRLNIWKYDTNTKSRQQVTKHKNYDVKWPSMGPGSEGNGEIVYQQGGSLRLLDLGTEKSEAVKVTIPGDRPRLRTQHVDASDYIRSASISPKGKRVAVEARGDIWSAPAKNGTPRNLTATSGIAERYPAWSPDGRWIAYFSDATDEYELMIMQSDGRGETRRLTSDGAHWRYDPVWSPDSKMIVFTDKAGAILLHDVASKTTSDVDREEADDAPSVSWSHDSRWLAYHKTDGTSSGNSAIWVYEVEAAQAHQLTSGYFNDSNPAFDREGDFIYYQSNRSFKSPTYEDLGTTFVYEDTGVLLALPLRTDVKNPLLPEIDEVEWSEEESENAEDEESSDSKDEDEDESEDGESGDGDSDEEDDESESDQGDSKKNDPTGVWSLTVDSELIPEDERTVTLTLKLDSDGTLSGEIDAGDETIGLTDTTFDQSTGEFTANITTPMGAAKLSGVISDDEITGTVTISVIGMTADIHGTREGDAGDTDDGDNDQKDKGSKKKNKEKDKPVTIDFEDAERRVIPVPVGPGNFRRLVVNASNHLIYQKSESGESTAIKIINLKADEPKEQNIVSGGGGFELSADGKKMLLIRGGAVTITDAAAGKGAGKPVKTSRMIASIQPREEWEQVFNDAWRMQRDFFYDPNMHGVNWKAVRKRYGKLLSDATSRSDVGFIIGEMISELNVGHAYYRGIPDDKDVPNSDGGTLGCRIEPDSGRFKIAEFYEGGAWDTDAQSPLRVAGAKVGQYILEIEGRKLTDEDNPFSAMRGLGGQLVTVIVSDDTKVDDDDTRIHLRLPRSDAGLRFRHWIEGNRKTVDEATDGRVGYIFVTNTGIDGQNDLIRQFYAQLGKEALIIDDRWNGGGQIPTRFIELLNRPATNFWARRDSVDWKWPPDSHQGPKCMLINGLAGSGGDMFPALFKQAGLGKLIGRRTWGGLVGITGGPGLIDGASVTVPSFAYYELDGTWGIEGHGVDPDIEVIDDPALMQEGADPQLQAAIDHIVAELETSAFEAPERPQYPDRKKMGLPHDDQ